MSSFNLVNQPWIPVLSHDGSQKLLGLKDVLHEADALSGISAELPTVSIAIQRFLQAVLLRVSGPLPPAIEDRMDLWGGWWDAGLPLDLIDAYLQKWSDRFDLLDPERPFFQVPGLQLASGTGSGLTKLTADVPAGTKHFVTRIGSGIESMPYAEAAQWLIHTQAFDCAGIKSGVVGDARVKGGKSYSFGYPAFSGTLGIISLEGASLAETLLLNLHLGHTDADDVPSWESSPQRIASDGIYPAPRGAAQLWTWPSRMIRLIVRDDKVVDAVISNGEKVTPQNQFNREPMVAWRYSKPQSVKEKTDVYMPVGHDPNRAAWRGLSGILGLAPSATPAVPTKTAGVIDWLARAQDGGYVEADKSVAIRCVAMEYGSQASTFTRDFNDVVPVSVALLSSSTLRQLAVDAVKEAQNAVMVFRDFTRNVALASGDSGDKVSERHADEESAVYDLLRPRFETWASTLTLDTDRDEARTRWQREVSMVLQTAASNHARIAPTSAVFGRTVKLRERERHMDLGLASLWFRSALFKALPLAHPSSKKEFDDVLAPAAN